MKQLSQSKMQARKQQGLCFNYDEKYHFGQRCRPTHILMILPESNPNDDIPETNTEPPPVATTTIDTDLEAPHGQSKKYPSTLNWLQPPSLDSPTNDH